MKHLSLKRILTLALCLCLATTLLISFSPTRSAHAATASTCQTLRYPPGGLIIEAGDRKQWTTCAGNTMDLNMQLDGNFVLYLNGQPIWATNTSSIYHLGDWAEFQSDSNLVVYDDIVNPLTGTITYGVHVWDSKTNGKNASALELQSDGNMVIYPAVAGNPVLWSSHTNGH